MSKDTTDTEIDPKLLLEVLQNQTTLNNVKTLLQSKNVPHSASSWSNMIEERIQPAIADGTLVFDDLVNLVRDAEEHGRKHVRLFRFNEATPGELSSALDAQTVGAWAEARNYPAAGQYVFSAYPAAPFISEVRLGDIGDPNALVIKVARTEYRRKTGELQEFNGEEVIISRRVPFRAVDVLKVHSNGLVEVRMTPRGEQPIPYSGIAFSILKLVDGLLNPDNFSELSLSNAKNSLSDMQKKGEHAVKFEMYEAYHKNSQGDRFLASSLASKGGIFNSSTAERVISEIKADKHQAYCEKVRVSYQYGNTKRVNAILTEEINEIIFTAELSRMEFDETLMAIIDLN